MGRATNIKAWDTYVASSRPDRNFGMYQKVGVWADGGGADGMSLGYLNFARPFPLGAKILSATLTFRTYAMPQSGSHTIQLLRAAETYAFSRVTWKTKPNVIATGELSQTKTGALPAGEKWTWDVTADVQRWSDGSPWYGWRVNCDDTIPRWIFSTQNTFGEPPTPGPLLTIEWSDAPEAPESLLPNEGVVGHSKPAMSFEYSPIDEDATLLKVHVQTSSSTSFASPSWDSGERDWTEPTVYPGDLGYPGAATGVKVYWRIRVMDRGGWSRWSAVAEFTYYSVPGITMTAPTPASPFIAEQTPQISWDSPGQVAYHVTISRADASYDKDDWLWNSGKVTSPANSLEVPWGVIRRDSVPYRIIVRAYDAKSRISVANARYTYSGANLVVTFTTDPAITKVTDVVGTQVPRTPTVKVTWKRAAPADQYQIIRDAINVLDESRRVFVDTVDHADVVQPDGSFAYVDRGAPTRTPFRYAIYPMSAKKRGAGTLGNVVETRLDGIWLIMPTFSLMITGTEPGTPELPEDVTAHEVIGATAPTLIRGDHKGYRAESFTGTLVEEKTFQPGLTGQMKKELFLKIKEDPTGARLIYADINIPVLLANLDVWPLHFPGDLRYGCSFRFWQDEGP